MKNIGVVGGGLLGRLTSWRLLQAGCDVTLFEAGSLSVCPGAARTAAAMISPLSEVVDSERLIYDMGMAGLALWPAWNRQLQRPISYSERGSLVLAHTQDASQLTQFAAKLQHHLGDQCGSDYEWLEQSQIARLESDLSHFHRALYLRTEAHLDNHALLDQLLADIQALGGRTLEHTPVQSLQAHRVDTQHQSLSFDEVIDCRGVGAKPDIKDLRGVRGEVLWVQTPELELQRPVRFMHPRYKLYVVPKPNQQFIIGATEIESEDRSPISLRSHLELSSALYALNPAFAEARVVMTDVNLRPSLMDNRPRLERQPGLVRANGLYRHGYLLAPAVVECILAEVLELEASVFTSHITRGISTSLKRSPSNQKPSPSNREHSLC
ncbi:glycine oxidase ThiO [Aestuariicella hydrocarbonica]|uniref:Glycine oxidase ThiO n=1 Tax=Pseudomaricurvus hydrocarbonicus TaxID=1470433 RepID=A0A9E5JVT9_9GAMM|nr:glycine oxidase ThiO [Aestuariicella hydrocarbonica]NHO66421.1 glycine oxidase ThiO [Aestuariicella hydrocarbonica]